MTDSEMVMKIRKLEEEVQRLRQTIEILGEEAEVDIEKNKETHFTRWALELSRQALKE